MDQYITGQIIKKLREKNSLTQTELASKLSISDKTVSKWETGKGYPDITLLESLSKELNVSITELLIGNKVDNTNVSANMIKTSFYVCPLCGNIIHSTGEAVVICHGITLPKLEAEDKEFDFKYEIETIEDEYYLKIDHPMTKNHYGSFIAGVSSDQVQLIKLYPEGGCEARLKRFGLKYIYFYCNQDGLYRFDVKKNIHLKVLISSK